MKTDRFSDAIRRKLESIRPEFTDKDWTRMQSTLRQAGFPQPDPGVVSNPFSGGVLSGNSWLLAAASISTVALIGVGIWQRSQINTLRQTVSQLQQNVKATQVAPSLPTPREQGTAKLQRDTVYVDRYVVAPIPSRLERGQDNADQRQIKSSGKEYSIANQTSGRTTTVSGADAYRQQTNLTLTPKNDTYDVFSTPVSVDKPVLTNSSPSVATSQSGKQPMGSTQVRNNLREKSAQTEKYVDSNSPTKATKGVVDQLDQTIPEPVSTVETVNGVSASYESLAGQPLSTKSLNWSALLARQAVKRMRPSRPATPVVEQTPTAQPESQVTRMAFQVRAGVGAEVASHLWSKGVFTEILLGQNWLLGMGLNQTTYKTTFIDEDDFDDHTSRVFRTEFVPRGIDPKRERAIRNINTQTTRLQIPVYLGYRVPITQSTAFLPTVSTYLNLNSIEKATFYLPYYPPQRGYESFTGNSSCSIELINSLSLSTGIEWHSKHWVAQASPVLTIPFRSNPRPMQPEPNWQQQATIGLRARVLYQF